MQAVKEVANLPNPNNANLAIAAEVVRVVEGYLRLNVPPPLPLWFRRP